jgi:hypothetical protein
MKKTTSPSGKLKLGKNTIAKLNVETVEKVKGGMRAESVRADQCCDTDAFTNCMSRPGICW